mmetsp:Transcript_105035/g.279479  ORF Transcript_105035/g.279479 Transcript_105035/m.279479 type:complete len:218 (-) Transcript_105035:179-832(-)
MGAVCSNDDEDVRLRVTCGCDAPDPRRPRIKGAVEGSLTQMMCPVDEMLEMVAMPCMGAPCGKGMALENGRHRRLEELMQELFNLHDLNKNGVLEENELVQLNTKIKLLHHGKDADRLAVKSEYRALFREHLDPQGRPVPYQVFRRYMFQVLDSLDRQPAAQEMILEHFLEEAKCARAVFHLPSFASASDAALMAQLSVQSMSELRSGNFARARAGG